jgi:flagellar basal body-associated protein FliL
MAKDEKKEDAGKKAEKVELTPEEAAAKSKKKKLLIMVGGGVVLTAGIGGGLAVFLGGGAKPMPAKEGHSEAAPAPESEGHDEKKAEPSEKKEEGHEEAKPEGHGDKKEEGHGDSAKQPGPDGGKKSQAKLDGVDFGCTYNLKPFNLNLGNPLENRYVRLEIAIEYGCSTEQSAEMDKRLVQLRDAIIAVTSRKTREFLLGPDGKEQLRKEIFTRVNQYMSRKIDDVYITDILIE